MLSEDMPGLTLLYLLLAVAAGAGVQAVLLETEEFPEEEPADFQEEPVETEKIQLIENPLPLPKKHVPKVLDYKLNGDDDSDFDYPVADDDDFDH